VKFLVALHVNEVGLVILVIFSRKALTRSEHLARAAISWTRPAKRYALRMACYFHGTALAATCSKQDNIGLSEKRTN